MTEVGKVRNQLRHRNVLNHDQQSRRRAGAGKTASAVASGSDSRNQSGGVVVWVARLMIESIL